jgi:hypothetical protein
MVTGAENVEGSLFKFGSEEYFVDRIIALKRAEERPLSKDR